VPSYAVAKLMAPPPTSLTRAAGPLAVKPDQQRAAVPHVLHPSRGPQPPMGASRPPVDLGWRGPDLWRFPLRRLAGGNHGLELALKEWWAPSAQPLATPCDPGAFVPNAVGLIEAARGVGHAPPAETERG